MTLGVLEPKLFGLMLSFGLLVSSGMAGAPDSIEKPTVAELFAGMSSTLQGSGSLRARTTHVETLASGKSYRQRFEMQWDSELRSLRCEWAYVDAPYPMGTAILTPERLDVVDHVVRQRWSKSLPPDTSLRDSLANTGLDPLWMIAFCGRLSAGGISVAGDRPRLAHDVESPDGEPCHRVLYPGLEGAKLWVSTQDGLPRRLECTIRPAGQPSFALTQVVESLAVDPSPTPERFRLADLEGYQEVPLARARAEWRRLRQRLGSRVRSSEKVPEFEARDLIGEVRTHADLAARTLVVFWLARDPLELEELQDARGILDGRDDAPSLLGICASADPALRERLEACAASGARPLRIWTTTTAVDGAIRRFRVYRCPAYFLLRDGVVEISTRDLRMIEAHLDASGPRPAPPPPAPRSDSGPPMNEGIR